MSSQPQQRGLQADILPADAIDISMPISASMTTWEDRFAPSVRWHSSTARGDRTTNSTWTLNAHTGTHVDAPLHHLRDGADVAALAIGTYIGRCRVLDLTGVAEEIGIADLDGHEIVSGERLLLLTRNSARVGDGTEPFDPRYVALSADAARWLVARGITLIGIDGLGIEPYRAGGEVHRVLLGGDVAVIEGLRLGDVRPGTYLLVFLPLLLVGGDAAPGRAVLLPLDTDA